MTNKKNTPTPVVDNAPAPAPAAAKGARKAKTVAPAAASVPAAAVPAEVKVEAVPAAVVAESEKAAAPEVAAPAKAKPEKNAGREKAVRAEKPRKAKLVRDSYAMPEGEYARIGELKKRLAAMGVDLKKSELLRAGILLLAALNDDELKAVSSRVERIKTGRPKK